MMKAAGAVAVLLAVVVTGCSEEPAVSPSPSATPSAAPSATPTNAATPPDKPEQATAPPPASAGPVKPGNLPKPTALGSGWKTYDDPGGAEVGFQGNKTWTRRRDPHQAAFEALPIGCSQPLPDTAMPVPAHALQGSYRNAKGAPATALLLRFGKPEQAAAYFQGYGLRMRACGKGQLTVQPQWEEQSAAAAIRRYAGGESFMEVSVVQGSSVGLLASATGEAAADLAWSRRAAKELAAVMEK
ncbi:hypothetical protein [Kribbella deserti]|uniref:Lipoprotein n=1 Tax=Kribbella deserti TaxID=1926257 RepID=A0ABV6QEG8_9ACTN